MASAAGSWRVLYPTKEKSKVSPLPVRILKRPSRSVTVPLCVFFTETLTPGNIFPSAAITLPLVLLTIRVEESVSVISSEGVVTPGGGSYPLFLSARFLLSMTKVRSSTFLKWRPEFFNTWFRTFSMGAFADRTGASTRTFPSSCWRRGNRLPCLYSVGSVHREGGDGKWIGRPYLVWV